MRVFGHPEFDAHEHVAFASDEASGLRAIVAIHDTRLGPALGGCRMYPYASEDEALDDVLRLSRAMTAKAALAELPLGGGKSVIIGDPHRDKSPALFEAMAHLVDSLGGRYIMAEDVGTSVADMDLMRTVTPHVAGVSGGNGDPSPVTAYGVYLGILASVNHRLKRDDLRGLRIGVLGVGHVGLALCRRLAADGADLVVADVDDEAARRAIDECGAEAVAPDELPGLSLDVFAPCALGGIINDDTIARLRAPIVAGSANNQLAADRHGRALAERDILYAPDYVINAGGLISVYLEGRGDGSRRAMARCRAIPTILARIFARAEAEGAPTHAIADRLAAERLASRPPRPAVSAA